MDRREADGLRLRRPPPDAHIVDRDRKQGELDAYGILEEVLGFLCTRAR